MEINRQLQEAFLGSGNLCLPTLKITNVRKESSAVYLPETQEKYLAVIKVYYEDAAGTTSFFDFGSLHIMETMCHIGQKVFNPTVAHDDVPYRTAELVANFLYPSIGENPLFVFALCEVCLMVHHPADAYYEMLLGMRQVGFKPKSEAEIYDFVTANLREAKTGQTIWEFYDHQVGRDHWRTIGVFYHGSVQGLNPCVMGRMYGTHRINGIINCHWIERTNGGLI